MTSHLTPIQAIRQMCRQCTGNQLKQIRDCTITDCPLYEFRMGKNPRRKNIGGRKPVQTKNPNSSSLKSAKGAN